MSNYYLTTGVFGHYFVQMLFLISTLYGLNFYYTGQDYGSQIDMTVEPDDFWDTIFADTLNGMLEILSIINPFLLVKLFMFKTLDFADFEALNLFILRPIGWVAGWMEAEFILNKLRGISG